MLAALTDHLTHSCLGSEVFSGEKRSNMLEKKLSTCLPMFLIPVKNYSPYLFPLSKFLFFGRASFFYFLPKICSSPYHLESSVWVPDFSLCPKLTHISDAPCVHVCLLWFTGNLRVCTYCCRVVLSCMQQSGFSGELKLSREDLRTLPQMDSVDMDSGSYQEFGWWTPVLMRRRSLIREDGLLQGRWEDSV